MPRRLGFTTLGLSLVVACLGEDPVTTPGLRGGLGEACVAGTACLTGLTCIAGVCNLADASAPPPDASDAASASYPELVKAGGPRVYLRFESGSSDAGLNAMGRPPHASLKGACTLGSQGLVTGSATPLVLDGTSAFLEVSDVDFSVNDPFTFEVWIRPTALDGSNRTLFSKDGQSNGRQQFGAYLNEQQGGLVFERWVDSVPVTVTAPVQVAAPTYVVLVYTGADLILYLDGVERARKLDQRPQAAKSSVLAIGASSVAGVGESFFAGALDELAIYPRALSPTEVSSHFEVGKAR